MNKRVVIYSSKLHRGGAEKHLVLLVNELINSGWEIHLVVSQKGGAYERLLLNDVKVYTSSLSWPSYTLALLFGGITLFRVVKKIRPAVLYSIQDGPNIINLLVSRFLRSLRIPSIIEGQNNPNAGLSQNAVVKSYLRLCKILYPTSNMLICLSRGVQKAYLEAIPRLHRAQTGVIYNIGFVESKPFPSAKRRSDQWNLLTVGRLTKQKDFITLIKSVALVKETLATRMSKNRIKLSILGDGELYDELKTVVHEKNLDEEVIFHGFVDNVDQYYRSADLFILSSRWEGFGNVIVEAMSYAIPVIATDCDFGPAEIIEKRGVHGLLVPVGDEVAIASGILRVMTDDGLYAKLSEEGHRRSMTFGARQVGSEYDNCFRRVADAKK